MSFVKNIRNVHNSLFSGGLTKNKLECVINGYLLDKNTGSYKKIFSVDQANGSKFNVYSNLRAFGIITPFSTLKQFNNSFQMSTSEIANKNKSFVTCQDFVDLVNKDLEFKGVHGMHATCA